MALYINGNKTGGGGGNADIVHLTQAEYDALPDSKLTDDKVYMITDTNGDGSQFQPVIYSEDEREIGVWTDGKPLYQKTILFMTNNSSGWTDFPHEINNIDEIINIQGIIDGYTSGTNAQGGVAFFGNDTNVSAFTNTSSLYNKLVKLTIQYTKTTDTAGSGTWTPQGVPSVHYSTDEKVIGTWIDGSTIYERTITFTNITIPRTGVKIGEIEIGDNIIEAQGHVIENGGMVYGIPELDLRWYVNNTDVLLLCYYASSWTIDSGDLTIKYTKTSQGGN